MRITLFVVYLFFSFHSFGQDKQLLQNQFTQIMKDYPNKFKNLRDKPDSFHLAFDITGTEKGTLILTFGKDTYISGFLSTPRSDSDAKKLFDQWVTLINSIDLNGAKLITKPHESGKYELYCHQWKLDNSANNIAADFQPFTIEIMIIKYEGAYAAGLKIGDVR